MQAVMQFREPLKALGGSGLEDLARFIGDGRMNTLRQFGTGSLFTSFESRQIIPRHNKTLKRKLLKI
jgi:hypothetical protein